MVAKKRVAIIGAGVSGVCAVKICQDYDIIPVCFEQKDSIGGLWNVQNPIPPYLDLQARIYDKLQQNSAKTFYCYSDFPPLEKHPYVLSAHHIVEYLDAYIDRFQLRPHFHFDRHVSRVAKAPDYETTGRYDVTVVDSKTKTSFMSIETFDAVITCSGYYTQARWPDPYPGQEKFSGSIVHAGQYWSPEPYLGKTLLLVGGSLSAVDIAAICAANGVKKIYILMREGMWVMPQAMLNSRSWENVFFNRDLRTNMDFRTFQDHVEKICLDRFDHGALGLAPDRPILQGRIGISDDIDRWINNGFVTPVKGTIESFTTNAIRLTDGRTLEVDDVIFTTGYNPRLPYLADENICPDEAPQSKWWLYMYPIEQKHPTLFLAGMFYVFAGLPPVAELQMRAICEVVSGSKKLPSREKMVQRIEEEKKTAIEIYGRWPGMEVDGYEYMLEMARFIGCYPDLDQMKALCPELAEKAQKEPIYPFYYRLFGPHANWQAAKEMIDKIDDLGFSTTMHKNWEPPVPRNYTL